MILNTPQKNCLLGGGASLAFLLMCAALVPADCHQPTFSKQQETNYQATKVRWNYDEMSRKLVAGDEYAGVTNQVGHALSDITRRLSEENMPDL